MSKKLLSLALALVMCLSLAVPALAAESDFVIQNGVLTKYNGPGGNVVIPAGVTRIDYRAFAYNQNLTSVTIPDGVTTIGNGAFRDCYMLTTVTIPASVTIIESQAFYHCLALTNITIPNGVTSIGSSAFELCSSLTSLTIPASVTSITENPFEWCESLTAIHVSSGNQTYTDLDGVLFSKDMTQLISYPGGKQGSYVIPDGVTTISYVAFAMCGHLNGVTFPDSVTTIEHAAFYDCDGLGNVIIPSSVTKIGEEAFVYCDGLTGVTIPGSIATIEKNAFRECIDLTDVTILDGVTTIDRAAFLGCESLTSITIPSSVTKILGNAFGSSEEHKVKNVYYGGSEAQWRAISIEEGNDALVSVTVHYNSAAPQTPAQPTVSTVGSFTDVKASDYFAEPVAWAVEKGITAGTSTTTFSPDLNCTQGQILAFLWRAQGEPAPVGTVSGSEFYAKAAQWAKEQGLTDNFSAEADCTRAMVVTYLWKLAGSPNAGTPDFTDVPANADYAQAVAWAVKQGITSGIGNGQFAPNSVCTRGQIAAFLYRALAN